jgi:hypothetical protein
MRRVGRRRAKQRARTTQGNRLWSGRAGGLLRHRRDARGRDAPLGSHPPEGGSSTADVVRCLGRHRSPSGASRANLLDLGDTGDQRARLRATRSLPRRASVPRGAASAWIRARSCRQPAGTYRTFPARAWRRARADRLLHLLGRREALIGFLRADRERVSATPEQDRLCGRPRR